MGLALQTRICKNKHKSHSELPICIFEELMLPPEYEVRMNKRKKLPKLTLQNLLTDWSKQIQIEWYVLIPFPFFVNCPRRCSEYYVSCLERTAIRTFEFLQTPEIFIIVLKFRLNGKFPDLISFPLKGLKLETDQYNLVSVIVRPQLIFTVFLTNNLLEFWWSSLLDLLCGQNRKLVLL